MHTRKKHKASTLPTLSALIAFGLIALYFTYFSSNVSAASYLPTLNELNSVFGSGSYETYVVPHCMNSTLLYNTSRVNDVCSVIFIQSTNNSRVPYEISGVSYSFATPSAADAYIANVIPHFNSSPWPGGSNTSSEAIPNFNSTPWSQGPKTFGNLTPSSATLYYTSVNYGLGTYYNTVITMYVLSGSRVLSVSGIMSYAQNMTRARAAVAELLHIQYLKATQ
ncbi:MAG: hypothetical protein KGH57_03505 [Candidatus Micrarchaeota archaeon]|nr:hypothetical protein [Candidatus Micrarchaeota archaeon]